MSDLNPKVDRYILSFDVESLFTNIPTLETIDIIVKLVYTKNKKYFHGLTKQELAKLLIVCTQQSHFQFNNDYFDQVDGVSMGSPLGPLFANIFMADFEKKTMQVLNKMGLNKWLRYVDDIFATLKDKTTANAILEYLNKQHLNIRFTIEKEESKSLPFLDTRVVRNSDRYITKIYRKKTFTGVYLNWKSLTARKYKIGLINCLLNRTWRICTTQDDRDEEVARLKSILAKNEDPKKVVDDTIAKYIARISAPTQPRPEKAHTRFIVLPFMNPKVEDFAVKLKTLW